jgi:hypothetical protein
MSRIEKSLLKGACDFHVHCAPDVVPRAQDVFDLARAAHEAGMVAVGLKDHTTSTLGRCHVLNRLYPDGPRFLSSLVLNPQVGGLNPAAVESALQAGVDIIYFPTWAARHHLDCLGPDISPVPHPKAGFTPIHILEDGHLVSAACRIVEEIAAQDAILATGHISPAESRALLEFAVRCGVRRMIVTHASASVPDMSPADQQHCASLGALIEHSFLAVSPCCPGTVPLSTIALQIREAGIDNCILSSDFGQAANGPPVPAFGAHLVRLLGLGFSTDEIRRMTAVNPLRLIR